MQQRARPYSIPGYYLQSTHLLLDFRPLRPHAVQIFVGQVMHHELVQLRNANDFPEAALGVGIGCRCAKQVVLILMGSIRKPPEAMARRNCERVRR